MAKDKGSSGKNTTRTKSDLLNAPTTTPESHVKPGAQKPGSGNIN